MITSLAILYTHQVYIRRWIQITLHIIHNKSYSTWYDYKTGNTTTNMHRRNLKQTLMYLLTFQQYNNNAKALIETVYGWLHEPILRNEDFIRFTIQLNLYSFTTIKKKQKYEKKPMINYIYYTRPPIPIYCYMLQQIPILQSYYSCHLRSTSSSFKLFKVPTFHIYNCRIFRSSLYRTEST